MPTAEQLRNRLLKKLKELFQLDQPDLDFGFYRIMHAKSAEVLDFIDKDLLRFVTEAFGEVDEARRGELVANYEKAVQTAKEFGLPNPEETEPVKKAKAALDAIKDTANAEADVYDHLYRFFERYYDDGDFISLRYYTRETSGKAAPFAIPYNGEEVKLHWANADQYYIKSAEYFSNFTFDLRQAKEVRAALGSLPMGGLDTPRKVHFRIVEASEGEHGNVKASETTKRFFILHTNNPVVLTEDGELVINFEYRADPEKSGQENTWRDKRNKEAVETVLQRLQALIDEDDARSKLLREYHGLLNITAPTDSDKNRPLLAKYVNQYTARNTMDYFIHKDLGGFLRRELDFYIKNEVMRLDDIEDADAPAVETYLAKIKVLRRIAGKLVDFLAQLEDFQKKLWLKKKFVVETNYCITLDRVPEELYPEIAANEAQCEEWVRLFAIDEIQADLVCPGFSRPLTTEFLKANNKLVLDTRFFDEEFKTQLVASVENFDEQCDGLLIHSENFQALNLLQERFREQVKCVYIDPPYNTGEDGFRYKDGYKDSSWIAMHYDRFLMSRVVVSPRGAIFCSIDDGEYRNLWHLMAGVFLWENYIGSYVWKRRSSSGLSSTPLSLDHEYILAFSKSINELRLSGLVKTADKYPFWDEKVQKNYASTDLTIGATKEQRPNQFFPITNPRTGVVYKANPHRVWRFFPETMQQVIDNDLIIWPDETEGNMERPRYKTYFNPDDAQTKPCSSWIETASVNDREIAEDENDYEIEIISSGMNQEGGRVLQGIIGSKAFAYPKPVSLVRSIARAATVGGMTVLDYFAGSGTTGHAVIALNREDDGKRKYILVEMGDYFDTVLKPRIAKVVYSDNWKDGKPTARHSGISHCCKYLRLESYEDTLNNLRFDDNSQRAKAVAVNPALKEDYMLRYLLDVETRGSQSLLNIDAFADPTAYTLQVKRPGTDEYIKRSVDLIETFNYLIGLRVLHISVPQTFQAAFTRINDPELPEDQHVKLVVDGRIHQDAEGPWWFRKVEGWAPKDPANPNNGQREKVLIVWRKLTDNIEQDNLMLDEWFQKNRISTRDFEFDTIYVNGSNNLPNLKLDEDHWKVRLIEEEFMKRMWEMPA
jgi:adenine-specific DNA-methyltransferase